MHIYLKLAALSIALAVFGAHSYAQSTSASSPQAGQWEFNTEMKGMPFGGGAKTGKVCITANSIAAGQEKAFVEAGMLVTRPADDKSTDGPKCDFADTQRDASNSRWKVSCQNPRKVAGSGSGSFSADSTQITQVMEASTPIGKRTITMTSTAKRLGDC